HSTLDEHEQRERTKGYYSRSIIFDKFFIKYNEHKDMHAEYAMQQYIFNRAEGDPNAPRVPRIHDFFIFDNIRMGIIGYLVMEYIHTSPTRSGDVPEKVASALQWLRDLPRPSDTTIGSVAGPDAPYNLLKGLKTPIAFSSIDAIERYMNAALNRLPRIPNKPKYISFTDERLVFTQTDIDEGNFILDTEEKMCLIDFDSVAILPESFGNRFLASHQTHFLLDVAACLKWPTHNVDSMVRAEWPIHASSGGSFGLDENGFASHGPI
ncbi:hypothetical protein M413DRAFT_445255, partial [Hebeloma cylindrosporum]